VTAEGFAEFHAELRAVVRDVLAGGGPGGELDWAVAASSGWTGLEVPERLGGAGATFAEVAVVAEEMGRAAVAGPYLGTAVLGVGVLADVVPGSGRDDALARVAAGELLVSVALDAGDGAAAERPGGPAGVGFRLEADGDGYLLSGRADFVADAGEAGLLLVPAAAPDAQVVIVPVDPGVEGLVLTDRPVLDATRRFAEVVARGVAVGGDTGGGDGDVGDVDAGDVGDVGDVDAGDGGAGRGAAGGGGSRPDVWRFAGDPAACLGRAFDRAAVAVACDSLGLAEAMLEATVAHAVQRRQFGRPIGSFQAVKHACADMLVAVSVARELVVAAVESLVAGHPDAPVAASMAKSNATAAAVDVVGSAMQLHGGIGYTWESGVHAYLKRATLDRTMFGSPADHRRRLAARYVAAAVEGEC
jgi:alkylation response protein AidB-like acyl-CoA dehydrogenase